MEQIDLHKVIGRGMTADIHRATWRGLDAAVKWMRPKFFHSNPAARPSYAGRRHAVMPVALHVPHLEIERRER
jgi:serine/threonine-protein kinase TNNI3K